MRAHWLGYVLIAVVGVAVGAWGSDRIGRGLSAVGSGPATKPQAKPGPRKKKPFRKREVVKVRPRGLAVEQLQALGYVDGTYDPDSDLRGVVVNDPAKTSPGYNFYPAKSGALLIDMEGNEVHRWRTDDQGRWQHAELLPNGDVLVIVKDRRLSRYDKDSNRIWSVKGRFHHDLWIHGDEIYVLARVPRMVEHVHPRAKTLVDVIQVRSMDGKRKRTISLLAAIYDSDYRFLLPAVAHKGGIKRGAELNVLHTNHIEVFDGRLADRDPIYAGGNILISMRNTNAIAILDGESSEVLWLWGPTNVAHQHHPTLLDNGHILLFDNGFERSRVIEIDPLSQRIMWSYSPKSGFFSKARGGNQRLVNGNTLITESDRGYVLEVTREGEIVWKFANPDISEEKKRQAIWRMTRFDPAALTFLD